MICLIFAGLVLAAALAGTVAAHATYAGASAAAVTALAPSALQSRVLAALVQAAFVAAWLQLAGSITPLVRRDVIVGYGSSLVAVLDRVSAILDTGTLGALDVRVELAGQNPRLVAGSLLLARGLIPAGGDLR